MKLLRILGKRGRITIPRDIRLRVGFSYNDVLSFEETRDGKAVIVRREKLCDQCESQKKQQKEDADALTLFDFLNGLSEEQKVAAYTHLRMKLLFDKGEAV